MDSSACPIPPAEPGAACSRNDCNRPAAWTPVLLLFAPRSAYPPGGPVVPALGFLRECALCAECAATARLEEFLPTLEGWKKIAACFRADGRAKPKRSLTRLDWCRVGQEASYAYDPRRHTAGPVNTNETS